MSAAYRFRRVGYHWTPRIDKTPPTGDLRFIVFGWWVRLIWGCTFKPERFRWRRFYGHRLLAVRLWGPSTDSRLVGVQWQRASNRMRVDGRGMVSA